MRSGPQGAQTCPGCGSGLEPEISGAWQIEQCPRCRGLWLDPETFRAICEWEGAEEVPSPALPAPSGARRAAAREEPVRYRRCPLCQEAMARVNFARVSGVIVDVCRPHGAFLEAGELARIRRFLRAGGRARYARSRAIEEDAARARERERSRDRARPAPLTASPDPLDLLDLLDRVTRSGRWARGRTRSARSSFLLAAGLAAFGALALWTAFHRGSWRINSSPLGNVLLGTVALLAAVDALRDGIERWKEGGTGLDQRR
jgi:Zn-finger nucleic acid-binding protein